LNKINLEMINIKNVKNLIFHAFIIIYVKKFIILFLNIYRFALASTSSESPESVI